MNKRCEHSRVRSRCKECRGGAICEHNRIRYQCKECHGGSICEHNRRRTDCAECGGSQACEHGRLRATCSKCDSESAYKVCKRSAANRNHSFELTLGEYKWLVSYPCMMCGEADEPIGVDRVDSNYGYRFDNVQPMCWTCNDMKRVKTEEEFDNHIIKIIKHRPELVERAVFPAGAPV